MTVIIPGLYGLDSSVAWTTFSKNPQKYLDKFAQDPTVTKEIDYFNKVAPTFTSVDDLLKDRRATQYLLDAYGLGSEINNTGRLKKILTEDPTADTALVNQLADTRFKTLADSVRLDLGFDKLQRDTFREVISDKYVQSEFEVNLGEQDPALRQAAYFARTAATGSVSSVYNVLGDSILRDVIQTTFSIPKELAIQPVESQAAALASKVDFSKFSSTVTSASSPTNLSRAQSDFGLLQTSLATSDKAVAQIKILQGQLAQLTTNYQNVAGNTDPSGPNAATIALQQTAVPDLIRYQQLLDKGTSVTGDVSSGLSTLQSLITQAQSPTADLSDLKSQFAAFVSSINDSLDNATITAPDGSSQNILENGSADTISITLDDQGTTVSINRYDATNIKNSLNTALASFNAVTDSNDSANLNAALGRIYIAGDQNDTIKSTLAADTTAFTATVGAEPFYSTLNTTALQQGASSVNDSLNRLSQVTDLIGKIGDLASQSAALDTVDDRSALVTQFDTYRAQLRDLITNSSAAGLDNYLNNAPDGSYEITPGNNIAVKGNYDLLSTVADILDAGSLGDKTSAQDLQTRAIQVTTATDRAQAGLQEAQPYLDKAVGTYDAQGSLAYQVNQIKLGLSDLIAGGATDDGKNLLSPDQTDISLGLTTGTTVTLHAQSSFQSSFSSALDAILAGAQSGDSAATLSALNDASYLVDSTQRTLSSESRSGTIELGKLGGTIDTLTPKDTSSTANPYQANTFTQKFLLRYLTQNTLTNGTTATSGPGSYVLSLFSSSSSSDGTSGSDTFASLLSLSLKV